MGRRRYARVANAAFEGAPLHDAAAHFTVSKYEGIDQDFFSKCDVLQRLDGAEADGTAGWGGWDAVHPRVHAALSKTFRLLVDRASGISWSHGQCRALYGVDIMFDAGAADAAAGGGVAQPVLLEVNYSPDLGSISRFYPEFVTSAFDQLYAPEQAEQQDAPSLWEALDVTGAAAA